jgi:type IV fimbrial biogenesis protein FimT
MEGKMPNVRLPTSTPSAGFTLVELVVTLIVLAIIASLAAPAFSELLERRRLIGAAEALYAQVLFARSESIKQSQPFFVETTGSGGAPWNVVVRDGVDEVYRLESQAFRDRVQLTAAPASPDVFGFDPVRGLTVDDAGESTSALFQVSLDPDRVMEIRVNPIGRIRICAASGNLRYSSCD